MCEGLIGFEFRVKTKVVNFTSRFNQIYCLPLFRSRQEKYKKTHHCEWNHLVYELISTHGKCNYIGIMLIMILVEKCAFDHI